MAKFPTQQNTAVLQGVWASLKLNWAIKTESRSGHESHRETLASGYWPPD